MHRMITIIIIWGKGQTAEVQTITTYRYSTRITKNLQF